MRISGKNSKKIASIFAAGVCALFFIASASASYISMKVQEQDGSPSVTDVNTIKVSNGTLTDNGNGTVSLDLSGLAPSFTNISNGTNVTAAMVVGTGSSLTYQGGSATSGSINADRFQGTNTVTGTAGSIVFSSAPTISNPVITNLNPGADFTLTQNSVVPFTSVNSGGVANTLYLKAGNVGIGTTTTSTALYVNGTATATTFVGALTGTASGNLTAVTADAPLSGSGTSGSHLVLSTAGTWSGTATTATNAVNTGITDDVATATSVYPTWVTTTSGNLPQKTSSTKLTFVPSTGTLTTTTFVELSQALLQVT